ncbi:MAG: coproporphyrinogen III oxidase [Candidatus Melainabacteria bacterium HGW-Melainabacteria-1]|nr:MAG: coproporphyrinogen III oxidase [Candidatus Melainabacteria bacterium HGW-Melainabacteria-1]
MLPVSHQPRSLYLHLPFCSVKCHYCDFAVRVLHQSSQIDRYLDHLALEFAALGPLCAPLQTIYLGGGTPSLLNLAQIERLGGLLQTHFDLGQVREWTLEVNPESAEPEQLTAWRAMGVSRASLGIQSFDPALLQSCGRPHRVDDIYTAVAALKAVGLENFSLDLIFGLPQQSLAVWRQSLMAAISLMPAHLSLYALEVHPKTHFGHLNPGLPDEDEASGMYELACAELGAAGLRHYEIANWARPEHQSRHNLVYWQNLPFAAAGVGAHGYLDRRRYAHPDSLAAYYRQCREAVWPWEQTPPQSLAVEIEECVFLGLRLLEQGLDLQAFDERFGRSLLSCYPQVLPELLEQGLLCEQQEFLCLTPQAVLVSNEIFSRFLDPILGPI